MYKSMRKLDPRIGSQAIWASFPFLKIDARVGIHWMDGGLRSSYLG